MVEARPHVLYIAVWPQCLLSPSVKVGCVPNSQTTWLQVHFFPTNEGKHTPFWPGRTREISITIWLDGGDLALTSTFKVLIHVKQHKAAKVA